MSDVSGSKVKIRSMEFLHGIKVVKAVELSS
jgi:hypothetical protein